MGKFQEAAAIGSRYAERRTGRHAPRALHDEDDFPLPFLPVWVASFEEQADQDFSFSFAKIAWVGFQREQPARCCLVSKNRGRRSLPALPWTFLAFLPS